MNLISLSNNSIEQIKKEVYIYIFILSKTTMEMNPDENKNGNPYANIKYFQFSIELSAESSFSDKTS